MIFMTGWIVCFWTKVILKITTDGLLNIFQYDIIAYKNFCQRKKSQNLIEMPMDSHLTNRKYLCYQENWDSSCVNNYLIQFRTHLKLSSEKRKTDAEHFLYLVYTGLRRHSRWYGVKQ